MNEDADIRGFLDSWPYDPEESVRVKEIGGRFVVQVRLPFGIEQYERDNRPDGRRPHGCAKVVTHRRKWALSGVWYWRTRAARC